MNRIYRLIWSKALKCIVAVSETTKGRGKDNTKSQAVGGAPSISQEVSALKQARAPPYLHKLISLRNSIPAIALSAGLIGMYSGEVRAGCTNAGSDVTCTEEITSYLNSGTIGTFTNEGTINASGSGNPYGISNSGTIGTIANPGTISVSGTGALGVTNSGTIGSITNTGTIQAGSIGVSNSGTITSLNNSGTISAPIAINNSGLISSIANSGALASITNSGSIASYSGTLPTNYSILINGTSVGQYGQITFGTVTGTLNFGITTDSSLATNTYYGVLSHLSLSNFTGGAAPTGYIRTDNNIRA
ncbi:hypothetical protein ICV00_00010, partial [Polynucleobacter asymbioticus]